MTKQVHELRDGIHGFILLMGSKNGSSTRSPCSGSAAFISLPCANQIYRAQRNMRFEHSLGVMEMATRIFDQLFSTRLPDDVQERIADELTDERRRYWRRVVRLAGLFARRGHLPFSHAAEEALLPEGWNHERITAEILRQSEIAAILHGEKPPIDPEDVVDVAWDATKRAKAEPQVQLSPWKTLLNEIVCGNTFGAIGSTISCAILARGGRVRAF